MLRIRTVLFPTDRQAWSAHAFDQARAFACAAFLAHRHGAALHVVSVSPMGSKPAGGVRKAEQRPDDALRAHAMGTLDVYADLRIVQADLSAPSPTPGILDYAARADADLVVMATHGRRGLDHLLLGSVAESVVREATCPVLTVGPAVRLDEDRPERILVPVDFSRYARRALAYAKELARLYEAELHVLHVVGAEEDAGEAEALGALRDFTRRAAGPDVPATLHAAAGRPAEEILAAAERLDAGLVVIATHGRHGLRRVALGSVAERVVQRAPCPVFTVKAFGKLLLQPEAAAAEAA